MNFPDRKHEYSWHFTLKYHQSCIFVYVSDPELEDVCTYAWIQLKTLSMARSVTFHRQCSMASIDPWGPIFLNIIRKIFHLTMKFLFRILNTWTAILEFLLLLHTNVVNKYFQICPLLCPNWKWSTKLPTKIKRGKLRVFECNEPTELLYSIVLELAFLFIVCHHIIQIYICVYPSSGPQKR